MGLQKSTSNKQIKQINRFQNYRFSLQKFKSKRNDTFHHLVISPVGWGCRIYGLHLCRGARLPPPKCPGYDTKQFDGEAQVSWSFRKCRILLRCYRSQIHSGPKW